MADAMRVFLAVDLGDAMSDAGHAWGRTVAAALGPAASALTWVPPARIHITLRFFGELHADRVDALGQALTAGRWSPAFEIGFGGAGTYPPSGRPRVLWLGISTGREALVGLHDALGQRLASAGDGIAGTGNAGAEAVFTVRASPAPTDRITVDYSTVAATATEGADFEPRSGRTHVGKGQTKTSIAVPIRCDSEDETDETFLLILSEALAEG